MNQMENLCHILSLSYLDLMSLIAFRPTAMLQTEFEWSLCQDYLIRLVAGLKEFTTRRMFEPLTVPGFTLNFELASMEMRTGENMTACRPTKEEYKLL